MSGLKKAKPVSLKIDWATHEAATYACKNWHYSKCVPVGKLVKVGVWENSKFIGVVLFSRGAAPKLLNPYGLTQYEGCELTRIALTKHVAPVSRILAIAIRFLKQQSPGLRLVVSFADPGQGHHGGIYQATNWIYTGTSTPCGSREYLIDGKWVHTKSIQAKLGTQSSVEIAARFPDMQIRKVTLKHRYIFPLDDDTRERLSKLKRPYPKRAGSVESSTSADQAEGGGESPTSALHFKGQDGQA